MDIFLYIIFAVVVGGAIILRWWYNSPKYKGKEGENRVHNILMQLPDDYVILDDIVLQTNRGTTQIDHMPLRPKIIEARSMEMTIAKSGLRLSLLM